eukprot:CAMPEP_0171197520 /NCGR_PEP_ID=MMETSP0790-20130122/22455_1 /TAXON_ID=2925 /ORGANISM="Alexandrium catenella, Strain OF101" /LENGTH=34 /DNA_ID= /DNA_START= /DNA_END= /DNA_ORIENTATION=
MNSRGPSPLGLAKTESLPPLFAVWWALVFELSSV